MKFYIGVDGGGTKTAYALFDENKNVIKEFITENKNVIFIGGASLIIIILNDFKKGIFSLASLVIKKFNNSFESLSHFSKSSIIKNNGRLLQ